MTTAPRPSKGTDLIQPNSVAELASERSPGPVPRGQPPPAPPPRPSKGTHLIQPHSVADLAYERIRGLVLSGELAPGTRLGQVELAERFGISRTPVREALRRLAGEGLVDFHSNRGFRVADLGPDAVLRGVAGRGTLELGPPRPVAR